MDKMKKRHLSKSKVKNKYPSVKKQIKDFLADEEGKISKKDIAKLGVSLAVLGMMMQPGVAHAGTHTDAYANHYSANDTSGHTSSTDHTNSHANHSNHGNHANHGNHGNYSHGGWMC